MKICSILITTRPRALAAGKESAYRQIILPELSCQATGPTLGPWFPASRDRQDTLLTPCRVQKACNRKTSAIGGVQPRPWYTGHLGAWGVGGGAQLFVTLTGLFPPSV